MQVCIWTKADFDLIDSKCFDLIDDTTEPLQIKENIFPVDKNDFFGENALRRAPG